MVRYTVSKPPSAVNPEWIFWSKNDYQRYLASDEASSVLFVTSKKEIALIYMPTPVIDKDEFECLLGNMFDESSSPAFFKIDSDEIGSCCAIIEHPKIPPEFRPEIPLQSDSVKDTDWEDAQMEIALVAIPTLAPIPYGKEITSLTLDENFVAEMSTISKEHGFWAQTMRDVVEQHEVDNHTETVLKRIIESVPASSSRDQARAATKGLRGMILAPSPFVDPSLLSRGNRYEADQEKLKAFFRRNPTPARVEIIDDDENADEPRVPVRSTSAPSNSLPPGIATAATISNPPPEFFAQLIETMKNIQAPQQPTKIVVESRDHEETIDLAKLQTGMLQLMYATGEINWEDGSVKNIRVATFSQGFLNLLSRSASVQATQLTNLFATIFSTEPEDDDDDFQSNPLSRLMSMVVFTSKFTKGHLNASFQSSDLETGSMYKSTSINPFHYAPQGNRKLILEATAKMDEERNELNWRIVEKDRSKISSLIEGIGRVNNMDEVAMTCANICGVQLAMVDITSGKPLLFQLAWKVIRFIENKKTKTWMRDNSDCIAHLPMIFMAKIHQFFMHLASFSQNSINTNKIETGDDKFETRSVSVAVKLASKFFAKMQEHIDDNSVPKDVPAFAKSFFVEANGGGFAPAPPAAEPAKPAATQPADTNGGGKRKGNSEGEQQAEGQKKKRNTSDKSLKMGLFHLKKGTPASKALPEKSTLKNGICLDFCCHERKCNFNHLLCKNGKHYTNWKNVPEEDRPILLKHMEKSGLMWLDAETFKKHEIVIAPEFAHLLGDATGPKKTSAEKST
jgi:hypothetical protein